MILVPTDAPGFSWTPIVTVGENRTTATYYDDVRVPVTNLVGEENGGWQMITTQLNHERIGLAAHSGEAHELLRRRPGLGRRERRARPCRGCAPTWPGVTRCSTPCTCSTGSSPPRWPTTS